MGSNVAEEGNRKDTIGPAPSKTQDWLAALYFDRRGPCGWHTQFSLTAFSRLALEMTLYLFKTSRFSGFSR
jgi:hypothetical protein